MNSVTITSCCNAVVSAWPYVTAIGAGMSPTFCAGIFSAVHDSSRRFAVRIVTDMFGEAVTPGSAALLPSS